MKTAAWATVLVLMAFVYGFGVGLYQLAPFKLIRTIKQGIAGGSREARTPYYDQKISLYESLASTHAIVMLGDSLTAGCEWTEMFPSVPIVNRGIGGDTISGVRQRLDTILASSPKVVFLMIGINDLVRGTPPETVASCIQDILRKIKATDAEPVLQSTLLVGRAHPGSYEQEVRRLNAVMRAFCEQEGITYIDLNARLAAQGFLRDAFTNDGLHLTGSAYKAWADEIRVYVETAGVRDPGRNQFQAMPQPVSMP